MACVKVVSCKSALMKINFYGGLIVSKIKDLFEKRVLDDKFCQCVPWPWIHLIIKHHWLQNWQNQYFPYALRFLDSICYKTTTTFF